MSDRDSSSIRPSELVIVDEFSQKKKEEEKGMNILNDSFLPKAISLIFPIVFPSLRLSSLLALLPKSKVQLTRIDPSNVIQISLSKHHSSAIDRLTISASK